MFLLRLSRCTQLVFGLHISHWRVCKEAASSEFCAVLPGPGLEEPGDPPTVLGCHSFLQIVDCWWHRRCKANIALTLPAKATEQVCPSSFSTIACLWFCLRCCCCCRCRCYCCCCRPSFSYHLSSSSLSFSCLSFCPSFYPFSCPSSPSWEASDPQSRCNLHGKKLMHS